GAGGGGRDRQPGRGTAHARSGGATADCGGGRRRRAGMPDKRTMRMRLVIVIAMLAWVAPAAADLYRWIDPETGSVKFSSYPPPWYGDEAKERRAPKVEVIP